MKLSDRIIMAYAPDVWHPDTHGPVEAWPEEHRVLYHYVRAAIADTVSIALDEITHATNTLVDHAQRDHSMLAQIKASALSVGGLKAADAVGRLFNVDAPIRDKAETNLPALIPPRQTVFTKGMAIIEGIRQRAAGGSRQA